MNIRNLITSFGPFFSQEKLIDWTGRKMIFPFYHTISDENLPYISNLYPLRSQKEFRSDLDFFLKFFSPISIEEVYNHVYSNSKPTKPVFHLTFDDGLKEVYEIIAPILEEKGIPATFFMNTNFIDNEELFYRYKVGLILESLKHSENGAQKIKDLLIAHSRWKEDLRSSLMQLNYHDLELIAEIGNELELNFENWLSVNKPYLSTSQIKDLMSKGFTIGSHSKDHPRFKNIDLSSQKEQVLESLGHLEQHFDVTEKYFSFPFGDEAVKAELISWMYDEARCKLSFGVSGIKDDFIPYHIHRIPMDNCRIEPHKFIKSEYLYYMLKGVFNRNQIKRN